MPEAKTEQTTPEIPVANPTPSLPEPVQSRVILVQTVGGVIFELNPKTLAELVQMGDGTSVATRIQILERAISGQTGMRLANTIADRDALSGLIAGDQCWVLDATADPTVGKGGAKYLYMSDGTWLKIGEAESLDVVCNWDHIQGKPTSAPADIDLAVAKQHTHANYDTVNCLSDDGAGNLLFKGKRVSDGKIWCARVSSYNDIPANLADGGLVVCDMPAADGETDAETTGA